MKSEPKYKSTSGETPSPLFSGLLISKTDKPEHTSFVFEIVDFYPSISELLLKSALDYAKLFCDIFDDDVEIIMHSRKSLLFDQNEPWIKKGDTPAFGVTMGGFDGAEICELVGLFILHKLTTRFDNGSIGLYRDDGLASFKNMSGRSADKARKDFCKIFNDLGLRMTLQRNLKTVNFLDVTLDLRNGKYSPYRKEGNNPVYVNAKSNHPPSILKQIPASIGNRISQLLCDENEFQKASHIYNRALHSSGFREDIKFNSNNRKHSRKIIWFNPPYPQSVKTNVARKFLQLLDKHFHKDHVLHKIFNRNTVKVSYSCTPNIGSIIRAHNRKVLRPTDNNHPLKGCNCRKPESCPLDGNCLGSSLVYRATVTVENKPSKLYLGMIESSFKTRYTGHKSSFKTISHTNDTALSKCVWELKDKEVNHIIEWSIVKHAPAFKAGFARCNLCPSEKLCNLEADKGTHLNKRSELISRCRHLNKFLAGNQKPP